MMRRAKKAPAYGPRAVKMAMTGENLPKSASLAYRKR